MGVEDASPTKPDYGWTGKQRINYAGHPGNEMAGDKNKCLMTLDRPLIGI